MIEWYTRDGGTVGFRVVSRAKERQAMTDHNAETTKMVTLPITTEVLGQKWSLYTFDYMTQDGVFSGYLHALDMGHAEQLLSEMKATAVLAGQMIEAEIPN